MIHHVGQSKDKSLYYKPLYFLFFKRFRGEKTSYTKIYNRMYIKNMNKCKVTNKYTKYEDCNEREVQQRRMKARRIFL